MTWRLEQLESLRQSDVDAQVALVVAGFRLGQGDRLVEGAGIPQCDALLVRVRTSWQTSGFGDEPPVEDTADGVPALLIGHRPSMTAGTWSARATTEPIPIDVTPVVAR